VALDSAGHVASGTSTGGLQDAAPGRVGDSPMPGAGFYADDARGAVAFSGDGESIVRLGMAATVMHQVGREGPEKAVGAAIAGLEKTGGEAGGIALDSQGRIGWTHNGPNFAVAYMTSDMNGPRVFLRRQDESASRHG
jgi:L-asparaginase / beta-aspartyl-peptidase